MCWILSVRHFVKPTEIEEVACDFEELESGEGGNREAIDDYKISPELLGAQNQSS